MGGLGVRAKGLVANPFRGTHTPLNFAMSETLERISVTEDGGILKEVYQRGEAGAVPNAGDEISGACSRIARGCSPGPRSWPSQPITPGLLKMEPSLTVPGTAVRPSR